MPKAPRDQLDLQSQSLVVATACMGEKHRAAVSYQKRGRGDFPGGPRITWQCRDEGSLPGRAIKIPHAGAKLSKCAARTEPASHNKSIHALRQKIPRSHVMRKTPRAKLRPDTAKQQTEIQLRPDTAKQTEIQLRPDTVKQTEIQLRPETAKQTN